MERQFISQLTSHGVSVLQVPAMADERRAAIGVYEGKVIDGHPSALETEWVAGQVLSAIRSQSRPKSAPN